jgi:hypothetical protein
MNSLELELVSKGSETWKRLTEKSLKKLRNEERQVMKKNTGSEKMVAKLKLEKRLL